MGVSEVGGWGGPEFSVGSGHRTTLDPPTRGLPSRTFCKGSRPPSPTLSPHRWTDPPCTTDIIPTLPVTSTPRCLLLHPLYETLPVHPSTRDPFARGYPSTESYYVLFYVEDCCLDESGVVPTQTRVPGGDSPVGLSRP